MNFSAQRWLELWQRFDVSRPAYNALADTFAELNRRYAEDHRHYHTAQHIAECLSHYDAVRASCEHDAEVELALWFHDAVYNPRARDNEAKSAEWAARVMRAAQLSDVLQTRVHDLIMATRHDAAPVKRDAQILVDIDLAILGAEPARFDEYEQQVRAEYAWVPAVVYKRKRREVLQTFADRASLYATEPLRGRLEQKARENLARSLARL